MTDEIAKTDGVEQVEVLLNENNLVAMVIAPLAARPLAFRVVEPAKMILALRLEDGSFVNKAFPPGSEEAWQALMDVEQILVTEVDAGSPPVPEGQTPPPDFRPARIVRDEYVSLEQ